MSVVAVVGLGYVGLPLAVEFGKKGRTIGFDLSARKIASYKEGVDPTGEVSTEDLKAAVHLELSADPGALAEADFIIVAVPTPVDDAHQPDFRPLVGSSESVGKNLKRGATVVFESTVYPGATEEVCIPIIEKHSGLKWKKDFFVGYSPERINPGDKERTLTKIVKVVSGDTPETLQAIGAEQLEGVIVVGYPRNDINESFRPGNRAYLTAYKAKYNADPVAPQGMNAYAGFLMLAEALTAAGSVDPAKVQAAVAKIDKPDSTYPTGFGTKFDKNYQNTRAYFTASQWQGGKMVTVFPKAAVLQDVTLKPLGRP